MHGQMTANINLSTVRMTRPKANGNIFSFDYVIKEMVNVANVQPSGYDNPMVAQLWMHPRS